MRLSSLTVENFRAITYLTLTDVPGAVVLAGPNGCGKSCVLDAIRLLKSAYGSYEQDEMQMWMGEFQIDANRESRELLTLLQDRRRPLRVAAEFTFSAAETAYLRVNLGTLIENRAYRDLSPGRGYFPGQSLTSTMAATLRSLRPQVDAKVRELLPLLLTEVEKDKHHASLVVDVGGATQVTENRLLELAFSTYTPQVLGVIDYHGPNRTYNRQKLTSVNLTVEAAATQQRQHALYNSSNKYANLKTEMTTAYVRNLLISRANPALVKDDLLTSTLKELFSTFFPGKEFLGPQPTEDGRLTFLVRLANGSEHDIDELSSGEKEVVYGYLRLHSAAPRDSMIMIDEPELHLNPRLVSGLAAFYYRHLASRLGNQLWLVTHSDTLIREAVADPAFSVYHVQPSSGNTAESQATPVKAKGELENVVLALVGDLAAYRPGAKVIVFESTTDAEFDMRMACALFPELEQRTNPISAGNKKNVNDLYDLLEKARQSGHLDARFFAITDADDDSPTAGPGRRFQWDVYHIENYLLQPTYLLAVLESLGVRSAVISSEVAVLEALRKCAADTLGELVAHKMRVEINRELVSAINLGFDPLRTDISSALAEAILRSKERFNDRASVALAAPALKALQTTYEDTYNSALADGTWVSKVRGRDVLRRFVGQHLGGMPYERVRWLIISKMSERGYKPPGMETVLSAILAA